MTECQQFVTANNPMLKSEASHAFSQWPTFGALLAAAPDFFLTRDRVHPTRFKDERLGLSSGRQSERVAK
jgi:hypothetical protein